MEQVDVKTKIITFWKCGEGVKWLNELFFAGEAHWTDYLWFYGTIAYGLLVVVFLYFHIN